MGILRKTSRCDFWGGDGCHFVRDIGRYLLLPTMMYGFLCQSIFCIMSLVLRHGLLF
jgi:hypothetical protein